MGGVASNQAKYEALQQKGKDTLAEMRSSSERARALRSRARAEWTQG